MAALRQAGHDVLYAAESLREIRDVDLADLAMNQNRLVLSEDRDFGRIIFQQRKTVPGIVYFRLNAKDRTTRWLKLKRAIETFGEGLHGHFVVIGAERFRIRPLPDS